MLSGTTLLSVICVLTLLAWWTKKQRTNYAEAPTYPGRVPIIGHLLLVLGSCERMWESMKLVNDYSTKVGGVVKVFTGPIPLYVVSDPDDIVTVMTKCLEKSFFYEIFKEIFGKGLVTCDLTQWKKHRKLFAPFFNQRAVNTSIGIFNKLSHRLVERLADYVGNGQFDPTDIILNMTFNTVDQTILGFEDDDSCAQVNENYMHAADRSFDILAERLQRTWLYIPYFYNRSNLKKKQDSNLYHLKAKITAVKSNRKSKLRIDDKSRQEKNQNDGSKSFLDFILNGDTESEGFTDDEIIGHLTTFIIGAYDTTGTSLVLALYLIGAHPHVQERIYKELEEVFGDTDRDVEKDDLSKLIYLEAVIKESLRLYPVFPVLSRTNEYDLKLKNYTIPKRASIVCSIYGFNRHSSWGEDAAQFKPERWLQDNVSPTLFASFSLGRRNCIGGVYAMTAMKTNMVHVFRRYRVSASNTDLVLKFQLFMKPVSGHHISIELRS